MTSTNKSIGLRKLTYNHEKFIIAVSVLVVLVLFDLFTPIAGGQLRYYAKWVSCNHKPEMVDSVFGRSVVYHKQTSAVSLIRTNVDRYHCTPKEAELNGISANSEYYDFPLLTTEEIQTQVYKHRGL